MTDFRSGSIQIPAVEAETLDANKRFTTQELVIRNFPEFARWHSKEVPPR